MTEEDFTLDDRAVLVTGGTGSFGRKFVETVLARYKPRRLIVFSRDELKQFELQQQFSEEDYPCLRYFIGDVRDRNRLMRACAGVDVIVHAAAMKQIVAAERNPIECIATNIEGGHNLIEAAIDNNVERVIALSTDKAANPINLYGATKLCSDKLFIAANNLAGKHRTRFAVVRYGNVAGSRGSVIPYFKSLVAQGNGPLPVTDEAMTRFMITLERGVEFVLASLGNMTGGELFVPKLPSFRIMQLVNILAPDGRHQVVGIRPGEKLHEVMIPFDESRNCIDMGDYYIIEPSHTWWNLKAFIEKVKDEGRRVEEPFEYSSATNDRWMTDGELKALAKGLAAS
jgi:UDP-N-acetylglucosamine 4,6-dehydratase